MAYFSSKSLKLGLIVGVSAVFSLQACAGTPDRDGPPAERLDRGEARGPSQSGTFIKPVGLLFTAMDSDADAVVTTAELAAGVQSEWTAFGRKPSGAVFAQWSRDKLGSIDAMPTFLSFDRDFNGVVSKREFEQTLRNAFERLDKDEDGLLTRIEMVVVVDERRGRGRGEDGGQNSDREQRGKGGRGGGRPQR